MPKVLDKPAKKDGLQIISVFLENLTYFIEKVG